MCWALLGTMYGIGLGITFVGGFVLLLILSALRTYIPLWKSLLVLIGWPIAWGIATYKLWHFIKDDYESSNR